MRASHISSCWDECDADDISLKTVVVAAKEQVSCSLGEEAAILHMRSGIYYGLGSRRCANLESDAGAAHGRGVAHSHPRPNMKSNPRGVKATCSRCLKASGRGPHRGSHRRRDLAFPLHWCAVLDVFPGRPCGLSGPHIFVRLVHGSFTPPMKDSGDSHTSGLSSLRAGQPPSVTYRPANIRGALGAFWTASRRSKGVCWCILPASADGSRSTPHWLSALAVVFRIPAAKTSSVGFHRAGDPSDTARRAARMVDAAAREGLRSGTCLERSLCCGGCCVVGASRRSSALGHSRTLRSLRHMLG